MHSSTLGDSDFEILVSGQPVALAEYFRGFTNTKRLGVLAPNRLEGIGAVNLIMAHVTAFYNTYRATGEDFFAYPDNFTFQSREPKAAYGMFDIWPEHKDVLVGTDAVERLNAITDRGVNILLVPDGPPAPREYQRQQVAASERLIETCYAYSATGAVADPDLVIRCPVDPLADWCQRVCDSVSDSEREEGWQGQGPVLEQSFRRISRQEALARLA
ncbi:MAG: hypothetical protein OXI58_09045 [Gemmatimonadota bacterium]|nr:hypothetical protein [Gemmatimonadota bacterium]